MILVTIGGQLPFDRLVEMVDTACLENGWSGFAQIGEGTFLPGHLEYRRFVAKSEMHELACRSRVVVGHAGIGTIITAINARKPLVLVPRRADLGEHRNDHQRATVEEFRDVPGIYVAEDRDTLSALLVEELHPIDLARSPKRNQLIGHLKSRFAAVLAA